MVQIRVRVGDGVQNGISERSEKGLRPELDFPFPVSSFRREKSLGGQSVREAKIGRADKKKIASLTTNTRKPRSASSYARSAFVFQTPWVAEGTVVRI